MASNPGELSRERALEAVREAISGLPGKARAEVRLDSSLVTDLGVDSLSMIELAVAIEDALGLPPIPLHEWREQESEKQGPRYTVRSLIDLCLALPKT